MVLRIITANSALRLNQRLGYRPESVGNALTVLGFDGHRGQAGSGPGHPAVNGDAIAGSDQGQHFG